MQNTKDTDLIARVYPYEDHPRFNYAKKVIEAIEATEESSRYKPLLIATSEQFKNRLNRKTRESTESLQTHKVHLNELLYLELRFSDDSRTSWGLIFGTNHIISDIVLLLDMGVSRRHFALTYKNSGFDNNCHRLVVRDLGSKFGTQVTYDNESNGVRNKFDWIIDGFELFDRTQDFIVKLNKHLKFRIVVAHHDFASFAYVANVERFRQRTTNLENFFDEVCLDSDVSIKRHSEAHISIVKDPIYISMRQIVNDAFETMSRQWHISSGKKYACKRPKDIKYKKKNWEKEINMMKKISHVSSSLFAFSFHKIRLYLIKSILLSCVIERIRHDLPCI